MSTEPLIHSFETDCLPEEHRWAQCTVYCGGCRVMVHAFNNECMQVWVEWSNSVLCWTCFQIANPYGPALPAFEAKASTHPSVES